MSQKTILVADDDRNFLKIITDALTPRGYRILTSPNGEMAVQSYLKNKPDMLLVDVLLPQKDGFQVCEEIRRDPTGKQVPIVMMTAVYKMPAKEREAKTLLGVKEYMTKPIDLAHLIKVIEQLTA